jgi:hypothetical protein
LPRQGDREPWRTGHNYLLDFARLRFGRLDDGALELRQAGAGGAGPAR